MGRKPAVFKGNQWSISPKALFLGGGTLGREIRWPSRDAGGQAVTSKKIPTGTEHSSMWNNVQIWKDSLHCSGVFLESGVCCRNMLGVFLDHSAFRASSFIVSPWNVREAYEGWSSPLTQCRKYVNDQLIRLPLCRHVMDSIQIVSKKNSTKISDWIIHAFENTIINNTNKSNQPNPNTFPKTLNIQVSNFSSCWEVYTKNTPWNSIQLHIEGIARVRRLCRIFFWGGCLSLGIQSPSENGNGA